MFSTLLDFLFPRRSLLGEEGDWVTAQELAALTPHTFAVEHDLLTRMGLTSINRLTAAERYEDAPLLRRAIHLWKYRGVRAFDSIITSFFLTAIRDVSVPPGAVFCPVPLHWSRRLSRGFNQAEILAQAAAFCFECTTQSLLYRVRATGHQAHRTGAERRCSMQGSFAINTKHAPHTVILFDDVCTTGATLESAAKVLRMAGVQHVEAIVLALD